MVAVVVVMSVVMGVVVVYRGRAYASPYGDGGGRRRSRHHRSDSGPNYSFFCV